MKRFLSPAEEQSLETAISSAEMQTSGEIRVHLEPRCKAPQAYDRAVEVFHALEMHKTRDRNGVLIYVATEDRKMAVVGDIAIHEKVPEGYWNAELEKLRQHFAVEHYAQGLCEVVADMGEKLKHFFPLKEDDTNELSNRISQGD